MVLKKEGMVAYYGPGDTVTSFYAMVGEQVNYRLRTLFCQCRLSAESLQYLGVFAYYIAYKHVFWWLK